MKYDSKGVHKYLQRHQQQLAGLKMYFSKCKQISTNSAKSIIEINEEVKKNFTFITQDKPTMKIMKEFAENMQEKEWNQKIVEFILQKVDNWFKVCENILGEIKQKMREIDSKNQKKEPLLQKELNEFKKFLIESITSYEQNRQVPVQLDKAIVSQFSTFQINYNAILLESLSNRMQRELSG